MLLSLIAAIVGGASFAALLLVASKLLRIDLPRWIYPAAAGVGMIVLSVYTEYAWVGQTQKELGEGFEVVETFSRQTAIQPWTYIVPRIDRMMVVNHGSARLNPAVENVVLVDVYLLERLNPTLQATQFLNCATGERLLVGNSTQFTEQGMPTDQEWTMLGLDNPLIVKVCTHQGLPAS